jgi:endoglucanase
VVGLALALAAMACGPGPGAGGAAAARGTPRTVVLGKGAGPARPAPAMPGVNVPAIKVNTVGYAPGWRKLAVFNVAPGNAVVRDATGAVVYTIRPADVVARGVDEASQDPVWQVDFSAVRRPGRYTLACDGAESDPFEIGERVYDEALLAGLKSFYFQRSRTALVEPYAVWRGDAYLRAKPSHVHDDVGWDLEDHPAKRRKWKVEGGWHDAGNYDMYIPSTAPSAQLLLMAYEWAPERFDDASLAIPESGNGVPDVLDEARWGLVWILSLQEPSGAFRHREAVLGWTSVIPADEDRSERWIAGVSTSATAKAVAALAVAARVYRRWDPAFADRCAEAARRGWAYLERTPEHVRADGKGSPQPLWDDEPQHTDVDARFVAAAEMWRTFRDDGALASATALMQAPEAQAERVLDGAWANLSRWGLVTLARDERAPAALRREARERLVDAARRLRAPIEERDGYRCASAPSDYYWGHNSNLLEKAQVMAVARALAPDEAWLEDAARDQWHWILGRNPNGYSMVTRVGKGPARFYHMEWGPVEPPPPGFVVGGPNAVDMGFLAPGAPAKALLWDNPEALRTGQGAGAMWHWRQSDLWDGGFVAEGEWSKGWWAVTETDIYYNANFVYAAVLIP